MSARGAHSRLSSPPQPAPASTDPHAAATVAPGPTPPPLALLQCATATLLARYALRPDRCIGVAVERALGQLAEHPALAGEATLTAAYRALALAWRELLALNGPGAPH